MTKKTGKGTAQTSITVPNFTRRKCNRDAKPRIRHRLTNYLEKHKDEPLAILLSSGLDSNAVLFSALELGMKPVIYSFTLEDREARDFRIARQTAKTFGLKFVPIYLPTDLAKVKKGLISTVRELDAEGKSAIECLYAFKYAVDRIKEKNITSGLAADIYFVLSKKGCMHYKDCADDYRIPRHAAVKGPGSQTSKLKAYCKTKGKRWLSPWLQDSMMEEFRGTSWDDVNRPKQKNPLHLQYPEFLAHAQTYQHTNLQLGDSGISALFATLLDDPDWNPEKRFRSMAGVYNRLVRGEIKK